MIIDSRRFLIKLLITIPLFLSILFVSKVFAQTPIASYEEFKKIQHLNSDENHLLVKQMLSLVVSKEYTKLQSPIYAHIAKLKTKDGNWTDGKKYLEKSIVTLELLEDDNLRIDSLENISWIFFIRSEYSDAIFYVQKMTELAYKTGDVSGQLAALNRLALSYIELALYELAVEPLNRSLELARLNKDYDNEFLAILYMINTRINLENANPQETLYLAREAERSQSGLNIDDGYLPRLKGAVYQQIGDFESAEKWLKLAEEKATSNHDVRLLQIVSKSLSELYLATDKPLLALDYGMITLDYNNQMGHTNTRAAIHYLLSKIYQQFGDDKNSLKYLRAYIEFEQSDSDKNTVGLITTMDKRITNIQRQQRLAELDNALLTNKVMSQKNENEQQFFIFIIIALILIFCFFIIVFIIRHRMLKAQIILSMKDELTGVFCRNYLKNYLPAVQSRFERETDDELSLGVLIIDCDDFKFINDTFGHAGGDKALKAIVNSVSSQIREHDLLLRWGGDEFVLICESVNQVQMREFAKRIISSISNMLIEYDETVLTVTISAGYALHDKAEKFDFDALIKTADEFLLASKKAGKNNYMGKKRSNYKNSNISKHFSSSNM
jgi:diguanylate cyclase (GGDEF)-like protein